MNTAKSCNVVLVLLIALGWCRGTDAALITVGFQGNTNHGADTLTVQTNFVNNSIRFSPMQNDLINRGAKADFLDRRINANSNTLHVTATFAGNVVTLLPKPGFFISGLAFQPGRLLLPGLRPGPESDTLQLEPRDVAPQLGIIFGFALSGTLPGAGGVAELDIGGPGGGMFRVGDTTGLTAGQILGDLQTQIMGSPSKLLSATVVGDELVIGNGTTSNDISASVTDPSFTYSYRVSTVPEPAGIVLMGIGTACLLGYVRRRAAHVSIWHRAAYAA